MTPLADSDELMTGPEPGNKAERLGYQVDPEMAVAGELQKALAEIPAGQAGHTNLESLTHEVQGMGPTLQQAREGGLDSAAVVLRTEFKYPAHDKALDLMMARLGAHPGGHRADGYASQESVTGPALANGQLLSKEVGLNWISVPYGFDWLADPTGQSIRDNVLDQQGGTVIYNANPRDAARPEVVSIILPTDRTDVMLALSGTLVSGRDSEEDRARYVIPSLLVHTGEAHKK